MVMAEGLRVGAVGGQSGGKENGMDGTASTIKKGKGVAE